MRRYIPRHVPRFHNPEPYFGAHDRAVPLVLSRNADQPLLRMFAIAVEEYIVEQLPWRIKDDVVVLTDDAGLSYNDKVGLMIPDRYNTTVPRRTDGIYVRRWADFDRWIEESLAKPQGRIWLPQHFG